MTHVRSKAAIALVAVLLASCTGADRQSAGLPSEAPPQALEGDARPVAVADAALPAPAPPPPPVQADDERSIVVTGSRNERQDFNSPAPMVSVDESNLNRLPTFRPAQTQAAAVRTAHAPVPQPDWIAPPPYHAEGRDRFTSVEQNPFRVVGEEPVSTFSIDVDTA